MEHAAVEYTLIQWKPVALIARGNKMKRLHIFSVLVLFIILSCTFSPLARQPSMVDITLLHVNDTHGHILPYIKKSIDSKVPVGGAGNLATLIHNERDKNRGGTLLLSGGDMFQGTPVSNTFRGKPVLAIMNELRFDAMVLGNHEFDWGQHVLQDILDSARFPILAANIVTQTGHHQPDVHPYTIVERKGLRFGIIGITTPETAYTTKPDNVKNLTYLDPATLLPGLIKKVQNEGADMIVVLSHSGLNADRELARNVPDIDVIVGGHSHTAVTDPVVINGTIIVQAGCFDAYLGILKLRIAKETKRIVAHTQQNELTIVVSGTSDSADPLITSIIRCYNERIKDEFSRVVGETSVHLRPNRRGESNEGNLICDAMLEATGASVAFLNSGSLKIDIPPGKITLAKVFELLPYDNVIVSMDLTGKQILELMKKSATIPHGGVLQVSGLKVIYDFTKPVESRVAAVSVGTSPLDSEKIYRVATNDFLAAGGDSYTTFTEGTNVMYGDDLRSFFLSFLKRHSPVKPRLEERIITSR